MLDRGPYLIEPFHWFQLSKQLLVFVKLVVMQVSRKVIDPPVYPMRSLVCYASLLSF